MDQEHLFREGFVSLYDEDVKSRLTFTPEQTDALINHLTAPEVRIYLKELSHNIVIDLMRLDFTRPDDQLKLASKYGRAHGALELVHMLVTSIERKQK
jgi:hypothetical protein